MQFSRISVFLGLAIASVSASAVQPRDLGLCRLFATAGLTNLHKMGCAGKAVDVPVQPGLKHDVCLALHHGGADNLHEVGCPPLTALLAHDRDGQNVKGQDSDPAPHLPVVPLRTSRGLANQHQRKGRLAHKHQKAVHGDLVEKGGSGGQGGHGAGAGAGASAAPAAERECSTQRICNIGGTGLLVINIETCTNLGSGGAEAEAELGDAGEGGAQPCSQTLCKLFATAGLVVNFMACTF